MNPQKHQYLRINENRLWQSIIDIGKIGETPKGGSRRLALSDEDKKARDTFKQWCTDAGCHIDIDQMGNMFATRPGKNNTIPPIAAGSHLDTQPNGGKFDGVYGVLAALEVVRTLNDHNIKTNAPIEIINWSNEEGARFAPAMLASGVYAKLFDLNDALNKTDQQGYKYKDELKRIGYDGKTPCGNHTIGAFFEIHIEQGPILENNHNTIGIVTGGQGQRWYDITIKGQDAHSGTTPMPGRKDALAATAETIVMIEKLANQYKPQAVATVGHINNHPNSRNTIAGHTAFTIDLRHPNNHILKEINDTMRAHMHEICKKRQVTIHIDEIWINESVEFDPNLINAIEKAAQFLKYPHQKIISGAGHDAIQIARIKPAAMIFIPCKDGLSHNEAESAKKEDIQAGANVLLHAMLHCAA